MCVWGGEGGGVGWWKPEHSVVLQQTDRVSREMNPSDGRAAQNQARRREGSAAPADLDAGLTGNAENMWTRAFSVQISDRVPKLLQD